MKKIAYQGVPGAFSHQAALNEFGQQQLCLGIKTFKEIFSLLEAKEVDYALIPLENTLAGSIHENYDHLDQHSAFIIGESYLKIEHCLLGFEENTKKIKKVLSHQKALEQCQQFFIEHPWIEPVVYFDTAGAAQEVALKNDPFIAAIASEHSGVLYGLKAIKKRIQDHRENYTRFGIVSLEKKEEEEANKFSLLVTLPHQPGSLAHLLAEFAKKGINLTKLESRPDRNHPFEYIFYLDFEIPDGGIHFAKQFINTLTPMVRRMKILGIYRAKR
jgi:prephenate dehydratase